MNYEAREIDVSKEKHPAVFLLFFALLTALIFQLICSKNSPLYPTNDWGDTNCYFTVGKSILNGKVLYRDIYEQKGPILYLIYAIAAFLCDTSFFAVFAIYVIAVGLFLFFNGRIIYELKGDVALSLAGMTLLAFITHTSLAYMHGGSAEELMLWMLSATLFWMIRSIQRSRGLRYSECFTIGLFSGITLFIKYTSLGFYFGVAIFVMIMYVKKKQFDRLFISIVCYLLGIVAISIPVLAYFVHHAALPDLYEVYVYNNIFRYDNPVLESLPFFFSRSLTIIVGCIKGIYRNPFIAIPIFAGLIHLLRQKNSRLFLLVSLSIIFLIIGIYWGRVYRYYSIPLAAFVVFGFIAAHDQFHFRFRSTSCMIMLALAASLSYGLSENTYFMHLKREDLPPYQFAAKINSIENATLFDYSALDGGFYHAAGVLPTNKYFCTLNLEMPEIESAHLAIIENAEVDFIVTRDRMLDTPKYQCVDTSPYFYENRNHIYYLYQRTEDSCLF